MSAVGVAPPTRDAVVALARRTQDTVCAALERLENGAASFRSVAWTRPGGGGESRFLRDGDVFESAGVNVSVVHGLMPPGMAALATEGRVDVGTRGLRFWASGVSVVIHPRNPMAPTAHANYRYFELLRAGRSEPAAWWFGGGSDLTPSYLFVVDATHFHSVHKTACDRHDLGYYPRFKRACDDYFLLPHRNERRGVGGIFFDRLSGDDPAGLLGFVTNSANAFAEAYLPIVERRKDLPFGVHERAWQLLRRGRYVEFNLMHDRGTQFGLQTGGRAESILMSLPVSAGWRYEDEPPPGTEEAKLVHVLRNPREWL
jgi:coproporphyrinogen III oxidase